MKANNEYIKWLKKWIDGSLTAREEQQLDAHAQNDPFLKDAIDGLRAQPDADHSLRLDRLRKKINQPEERKAVIIPLYLRRIAAILILALTVGTIWWINRPEMQSELSLNDQEATEEDSAQEDEVAVTETEISTPSPAPNKIEPSLPAAPSSKKETSSPPPAVRTESADMEIDLEEEVESDLHDNKDLAMDELPANQEGSSMPLPTPVLPSVEESLPIATLSGRVVDPAGFPVAGAVITNQEGEKEAISDPAGYFNIMRNNLADDAALTIHHFNYGDTVLNLPQQKAESLLINLNQPASLALARNLKPIDQNQPYPIGGFEYFTENEEQISSSGQVRARKSRKAPTNYSVKSDQPAGTTIVFTVYQNGRIDHFEVLEAVDSTRAKAAINLLKNGPKWQLPPGVDSMRTQITIPWKD